MVQHDMKFVKNSISKHNGRIKMLDKNTKIFVAGHHGLVGSAIWNNLKQRGYNNLVGRTHKELDLLDPVAVKRFLTKNVLKL